MELRKKAEEIFAREVAKRIDEMHGKGVAYVAEKIARAAGMDADKAYVFGLLHDVGKEPHSGWGHIMIGYEKMMQEGLPEVARICLTHSFPDKCVLDDIPDEEFRTFVVDFVENTEYDDYDRLVQLADFMACSDGVVPIEWRVCDIALRHQATPNFQAMLKKIYELKAYFAKKCGVSDLYELFDEEFKKVNYHKVPGEFGDKLLEKEGE